MKVTDLKENEVKATAFITPTQTKEEYAKERAIGFAKWWVENEILCYKSYYYDNNGNEYRSINELYDEYLKSINHEGKVDRALLPMRF